MKKILMTIFISGIISISFGYYIFNTYRRNIMDIVETAYSLDKVYMILYGSYNKEEKVKKINLNNYILLNEDNYYRVYVGVTKNYDNALKIKDVYKNMGFDVYIKEKGINNLELIDYLDREKDFTGMSDSEILEIENEVINKYEEGR